MHLSVIIVNFNVKYFLEQCLHSVLKACKNIEAEIWVVDNNSSDGSKTYLPQKFNKVKFIWLNENVGFAKANNIALKNSTGKHILFLNPDTIIPEDCFEKCFSFIGSNEDVGALGLRMIDGTGQFLKESKRSFPSPLTSLFKLSGLARIFPNSKTFAKYHLGHISNNKNSVVDVLAGAFMLIPKKNLDIIGGFDEDFFMYGEDIDLSYRIQKAGFKNYYFADCTIIHFKGESTKKGSLNYIRLFYKAMSLFVTKHYKGSKVNIYNSLIQIAIFGRAIFSAIISFLKKIGLPLLDAGLIFSSFIISKYLWNKFVRNDLTYSPNIIYYALPAFSFIFLLFAFLAGLYNKNYKNQQLIYATAISSLVVLSGYSMLPEQFRFSRGIMALSILFSFNAMFYLRWLFIKNKLLTTNNEDDEYLQTVVVADINEFIIVSEILANSNMQKRILGNIAVSNIKDLNALGSLSQLQSIVKKFSIKEIIFCEANLSFKKIIEIIQTLPKDIRNKFYSQNSFSIVGSNSKDIAGEIVSNEIKYAIETPYNKRNKRLLDIVISFLFLFTFPIHLFFQKKRIQFFKNIFNVILNKKTWVGYTLNLPQLPKLNQSILTSSGLPASLSDLPIKTLQHADIMYAINYSIKFDIKKVIKNYYYLGW